MTSSRDASRPAGFGEGRAGEDLPRDSDQSPLVQPTAGERDREQSLLDQHLIEVIRLRRTSHPRGFGERKISSVAPPKIARSPVNDHEKEAVVIGTDALGRDRKIEQSLADEIVEILRVEVIPPDEQPSGKADDFGRWHPTFLSSGCGRNDCCSRWRHGWVPIVRIIACQRRRSAGRAIELIAVARARLPAEEVDSLVAGDLEYPRGAHCDLWAYLPKSDPDLLEQVLDVIPSEAVLERPALRLARGRENPAIERSSPTALRGRTFRASGCLQPLKWLRDLEFRTSEVIFPAS